MTDTHTSPANASSMAQCSARLLCLVTAAVLASCATPPTPAPPPAPAPAPAPPAPQAAPALPPPALLSNAATPRDYRADGARHIYGKQADRIYKGKMPPLLQGVGVMHLDLDARGEIVSMSWMRAPSHAGARAEIERTVRASAPYPAPVRMGGVRYTDTWLWDASGKFQLDTLTEGQRNR